MRILKIWRIEAYRLRRASTYYFEYSAPLLLCSLFQNNILQTSSKQVRRAREIKPRVSAFKLLWCISVPVCRLLLFLINHFRPIRTMQPASANKSHLLRYSSCLCTLGSDIGRKQEVLWRAEMSGHNTAADIFRKHR